jgi:hypothetical protein
MAPGWRERKAARKFRARTRNGNTVDPKEAGPSGTLERGPAEREPRRKAWRGDEVVDSEEVSRRLAHDSTRLHVDLLNFRVRDGNG